MAQKALLAAIDHYPNPQNNLPSCLTDARAFERMLRGTFGFTEIKSLSDAEANLANVEAGLDWLFAGAAPSDSIVFYFSGHGYQARRGDNLDEVLCLYDGFLFDDALSQRTRSLPPGVFTLVCDSCHSGGMYKIMADPQAGDAVQVAQAKILRVPPPEEADKAFVGPADVRSLRYKPFCCEAGAPAAIAKKFGLAVPKGFDEGGQLAMNGLLLSACLEDETASASTPKTDGKSAFTFALLRQIEALGPDVSNARLVEALTKSLRDLGFRQTPVLMEPPTPAGLADRTFLTLGEGKPTTGTSGIPVPGNDVIRVVQETINKLREAA